MKPKVIVSLTSHTKPRLHDLPLYLFHSILKYNYDYVKIVLTLAKSDLENISPELQLFIDNGLIELIVAEEDLQCHLKYFYAMKKYRDLPIITIDDDSIYPKEMIPDLLKAHEKYPGVVIGRSAVVIPPMRKYKSYLKCDSVNCGIDKIRRWNKFHDQIRSDLNLEGYGGILYPPNVLKIEDTLIPRIKRFFRADDIYLYFRERELGVKMIVPKYQYNKLDKSTKGYDSISLKEDNLSLIDGLLRGEK